MRNPLSKKVTSIQPSGIRKFFDIVSEMDDVISLGVGEPPLLITRLNISLLGAFDNMNNPKLYMLKRSDKEAA